MTTPTNGLPEKNFIQDDKNKNPLPYWLWGFLFTIVVALIWGMGSWYNNKIAQEQVSNPFLQVTNRDLSLFLWQNSVYMRNNVANKNGYLTGFQLNKVSAEPGYADEYAIAPPELLFLYHTWQRLLQDEFTLRKIPLEEFRQFIEYTQEWQPKNWPNATESYTNLINTLASTEVQDLNTLPYSTLPLQVRMAFQGWKNYFIEGDEINKIKPTYAQTKEFLQTHPHYARNFWRNIVMDTYPDYLNELNEEKGEATELPESKMAPFFKVGIYNFLQAEKEKAKKETK